MDMKFKKIISASRRVDLLTFYPDFMLQKLKEVGEENIHTLVIWTKDPRNLYVHKHLRKSLNKIDQLYVLLTITGLGGTPLEPRAPTTDKVLLQLNQIADLVGSPKRIGVRYDPLIDLYYQEKTHLTNIEIGLFIDILRDISSVGIKRVITSYVTLYPKVIKRLKQYNFQIVDHPISEIKNFIQNKMIPLTKNFNVELSTCVFPDLTKTGCIDGRILSELHPQKEPCSLAKDPSQRPACHCTRSTDIGEWFSCYHGCLYCYGNPKIGQEGE
jgi:DNA repair photolyase